MTWVVLQNLLIYLIKSANYISFIDKVVMLKSCCKWLSGSLRTYPANTGQMVTCPWPKIVLVGCPKKLRRQPDCAVTTSNNDAEVVSCVSQHRHVIFRLVDLFLTLFFRMYKATLHVNRSLFEMSYCNIARMARKVA